MDDRDLRKGVVPSWRIREKVSMKKGFFKHFVRTRLGVENDLFNFLF